MREIAVLHIRANITLFIVSEGESCIRVCDSSWLYVEFSLLIFFYFFRFTVITRGREKFGARFLNLAFRSREEASLFFPDIVLSREGPGERMIERKVHWNLRNSKVYNYREPGPKKKFPRTFFFLNANFYNFALYIVNTYLHFSSIKQSNDFALSCRII